MHRAIDLDDQHDAVRQIKFGVDVSPSAVRIPSQRLTTWPWQPGAQCDRAQLDFGQRVATTADIAEDRPHNGGVPDPACFT